MCTLTFFPRGEQGFILTSNRDEIFSREPSELPTVHDIQGKKLLFPRDPQGGGTWIAASEDGRVACLLNGAFGRHKRNPPYRMSRGIVMLEQFLYNGPCIFFEDYNLKGIEPFTLVILDQQPERNITIIKWDGKDRYISPANAWKPGIWFSPMLYPPEIVEKRQQRFESWMKDYPQPEIPQIRHFHLLGRDESDEGEPIFLNSQYAVHTVSVTTVYSVSGHFNMLHHNFGTDVQGEASIKLNSVRVFR